MRAVAPVELLAEGLEGLVAMLAAAPATDAAALAEARRLAALAAGLEPYLQRCTSPESPALADLAVQTRAHAWDGHLEAEMLSGHVEGRFLATLARAMRAREVLELGLFTGYSALAIAEALPADGRVVACELDPATAQLARGWLDASPAGARVEIEVGPAADTLTALTAAGARFDLIFIDADKPGYADYLEAILAGGLLHPDGLICVDNTLMQGEPWSGGLRSVNGQAIARFNEVVAHDDRVQQVLLPLRDGLTLIQLV